jgi:hypothetical protein
MEIIGLNLTLYDNEKMQSEKVLVPRISNIEGLINVESIITLTLPLFWTASAVRSLKERQGDAVKVQVIP